MQAVGGSNPSYPNMFEIGDKVKFDRNKDFSLYDIFRDQVFTVTGIKQKVGILYTIEIAVISSESIKDLDIQNPHRFLSTFKDDNNNLVFPFY